MQPFPSFVPKPTQNPAIPKPQSLKFPISSSGLSKNGVVPINYLLIKSIKPFNLWNSSIKNAIVPVMIIPQIKDNFHCQFAFSILVTPKTIEENPVIFPKTYFNYMDNFACH